MTTLLPVQNDVPISKISSPLRGVPRKYPLDTMEVGEFFFSPGSTTRALSSYISRVTRNGVRKFKTRHCWMILNDGKWAPAEKDTPGATEGVAVWRKV